MKESQYIFDSSNSLYYASIIISCFLAIILINYVIKLKIEFNNKEFRRKYLTYIGFLFVAILMMIHGGSAGKKYFDEIKNNVAITVGRTLKHEIGDGYNHITFEFTANGKYYEGASGLTYNGFTINNITVPNGQYRVLYNKANPKKAVMDFKIKK